MEWCTIGSIIRVYDHTRTTSIDICDWKEPNVFFVSIEAYMASLGLKKRGNDTVSLADLVIYVSIDNDKLAPHAWTASK